MTDMLGVVHQYSETASQRLSSGLNHGDQQQSYKRQPNQDCYWMFQPATPQVSIYSEVDKILDKMIRLNRPISPLFPVAPSMAGTKYITPEDGVYNISEISAHLRSESLHSHEEDDDTVFEVESILIPKMLSPIPSSPNEIRMENQDDTCKACFELGSGTAAVESILIPKMLSPIPSSPNEIRMENQNDTCKDCFDLGTGTAAEIIPNSISQNILSPLILEEIDLQYIRQIMDELGIKEKQPDFNNSCSGSYNNEEEVFPGEPANIRTTVRYHVNQSNISGAPTKGKSNENQKIPLSRKLLDDSKYINRGKKSTIPKKEKKHLDRIPNKSKGYILRRIYASKIKGALSAGRNCFEISHRK